MYVLSAAKKQSPLLSGAKPIKEKAVLRLLQTLLTEHAVRRAFFIYELAL